MISHPGFAPRFSAAPSTDGAIAGHDLSALPASLASQMNANAIAAVAKNLVNVLARTPAKSVLLDLMDDEEA